MQEFHSVGVSKSWHPDLYTSVVTVGIISAVVEKPAMVGKHIPLQ